MNAIARPALARLVRSRRGWAPIALVAAFGIVAAIGARGRSSGADTTMRGAFAAFVLPLVAFAITQLATGEDGVRPAVRELVLLGASPLRAALGTILVAAGAAALSGAGLGALVAGVAHGASDPPLAFDIFTSAWIGALGGAAYAALFAVGGSVGRGGLRGVLLAVDWVVGSSGGLAAALTPRGHIRSLVGGALVADLPRRASSIALVALFAVFVVLAVRLARRPIG